MTSLAPPRDRQPAADAALRAGHRITGIQRRVPALQILVLTALIVYVGAKDGDFGWNDLWSPILLQASFLGIAAAGQTLAILVGGLDFSIAAYIVAGNLLVTHLTGLEGWNFALSALITLAVCLAGGALSGWVCHRFGLEPLVVTLGMSSVVIGVLLGTDSTLVNGAGPGWLQSFTAQSSKTFGVPVPPIVAAWILLAAVITVILAKTPLGRRLYLAGAGPRAADLAGISTRRVWTGVYAASAVLAGLAGVLLAGFSTGGDTNIGNNYLFPGLAAVIVGGTMMGGRGDYLRTCLGALIITALNFVISVLNVNAAAAQVVFGALILATVALYGRERRLRDRVLPRPSTAYRNEHKDCPMRLHHAGISVPDLDRALAWYCAALGLRPGHRFEVPRLGLRGAFALGDGGTGVELLEMAGAVPGAPKTDPPSANAVHGYNHACFRVDDLDGAFAQLVEHGAVSVWAPRDSPEPGVRMAYVTDPDGNLIELIAPAATAVHP